VRIAVDALGIHYFGGGRTATLRLMEALFALDAQNDYLVFLTREEPSLQTPAGNVRQWIAPTKNRLLLRLWAQLTFPRALRGYDLVHYVKNLGVFGAPIKSVVTIYDLTTLVLPELFPALDVWYWRTLQKRTLWQADRVIAISHNTASDLRKFYGLPEERIRVIYPAQAPHFAPPTAAAVAQVREKYRLPEQFILHVGRLDRKKNLPLLARAFASLRRSGGFDGQLVLVGEEYRKSRDASLGVLIDQLGLRPHICFTGPLPDDDLPAIYGAALAAVYCSLHEGFGIVALEALACGTPLVVTPAGAILEAVGEAACILPAPDPELLADRLHELIADPEARVALRQKGLQQAARFDWRQTAQQTLALYEEVCQC
jgi:glycosyltransferase involved in cell wall biosynthesis